MEKGWAGWSWYARQQLGPLWSIFCIGLSHLRSDMRKRCCTSQISRHYGRMSTCCNRKFLLAIRFRQSGTWPVFLLWPGFFGACLPFTENLLPSPAGKIQWWSKLFRDRQNDGLFLYVCTMSNTISHSFEGGFHAFSAGIRFFISCHCVKGLFSLILTQNGL